MRVGFIARLRPLPIAIFVAVLTLTVRVGNLWHDIHIQEASAAQAANDAPSARVLADASSASSAQPAAAPPPTPAGGDARVAAGAPPSPEVPHDPAPASDKPTAALPLDLTDAEFGLLQSLAQRHEDLERQARDREQALDLREGLLKAAEKRLDDKIAKLGELQASLDALLKKYDSKTDAQLQSLVKTYEAMKPRDAARIWDELDMSVLIQLVEHMREQKAAPILAAMNPDTAKRVTDELIHRRQLPGSDIPPGPNG
jgi:flagellar motility protein MotE (MotC chaperone)